MINDNNDIDNEEENVDVSLNDIEEAESTEFSIESGEASLCECPICIEPKADMFALVCGHTVCSECKVLLIRHEQLNVCPLCRFPLNWNGILQLYEDSDDTQFNRHVVGEIINANISPPENIRPRNDNPDPNMRNVRIDRERSQEFMYNMCAALVGVVFVIMFWFMIAGN